jgi:V/A-type H+-transporting ATPase subunit E
MADQVSELESAILHRAKRLAAEYRERAEHSRDNILRDAQERLHLREEREVLLAKVKAERAYHRKVQANELRFQKEMDHLRWDLVEGILEQLADKMRELTEDEERYLPLLSDLLITGVEALDQPHLIAEVNARDLELLTPIWERFVSAAVPGRQIVLSTTAIKTLGGVLIRSNNNRLRLDNTFEGRRERLASQLHQIIIQRLLPDRRIEDGIGGAI